MGSLSAALLSASNSLDVLEQAIAVTQSNVSNASAPGYVTQTPLVSSSPLIPSEDVWGGVRSDGTQSARDQFAERSVWTANTDSGTASAQSKILQDIQSQFNVSGRSGIPGALSSLYAAFSAWSTTPSDPTAQQQVLNDAATVAEAFNNAATAISGIRSQTDQQIGSVVTQVNQIASQIAGLNSQIRSDPQDAGTDAQLYNSLEQMSNLIPIQVHIESDGTATVLAGGQVPVVIGETAESLSTGAASNAGQPNPTATPDVEILTQTGQDITGLITGGQLGGLLQVRNQTIPSLLGDGAQQGSLNQLAQAFADRVNTLLSSGQTSSGQPGTSLFAYTAGSATTVASSLAVNPAITASNLAAASVGPPAVANGVASELAQFANPQNAADTIGGTSFSEFYSGIASDLGSQASAASNAAQVQTQALAQAQSIRSQISGVSLNQQAAMLLEYQQAYQASAQVISVVNSTTQYLMSTMQQIE
jgi:flagellar hook-associated protein 1 FlgK